MLADFFTKPLQGSLFRKMRDVVQGLAPINVLKTEEELKLERESKDADEKFSALSEKESKIESKGSKNSPLSYNKERVGNYVLKQDSKDDCKNNENKVKNKRRDHAHDTYKRTYKDVVCNK